MRWSPSTPWWQRAVAFGTLGGCGGETPSLVDRCCLDAASPTCLRTSSFGPPPLRRGEHGVFGGNVEKNCIAARKGSGRAKLGAHQAIVLRPRRQTPLPARRRRRRRRHLQRRNMMTSKRRASQDVASEKRAMDSCYECLQLQHLRIFYGRTFTSSENPFNGSYAVYSQRWRPSCCW